MASNGRTEDGYGWRQMVGRMMGLGSVKWQDGVCGWIASDGRTEDGYGWRQVVGRTMGVGGVKW